MKREVDSLWELQTVMSDLKAKEEMLTSKPPQFAAVDAEYQAATEERTRLEQRKEELELSRRKVELDLQSEQEVLQKYQGQLMQVKNQQQYAAAWKEIDATRKKIKEGEDELLRSMTEIEEINTTFDTNGDAWAELKERHDREYEAWQGSLEGLRREIADLSQRAQDLEARIPQRYQRDFRRIFDQRQGVAVVMVENGACGGCRVRIRPHLEQKLKRGEIVHCDGCHRIFYLETVAS